MDVCEMNAAADYDNIHDYEYLADEDFSGQDLSGHSFVCADLKCANFTGANLTGANFTGAYLRRATFDGANLTGVIGIEELTEKQLAQAMAGCVK